MFISFIYCCLYITIVLCVVYLVYTLSLIRIRPFMILLYGIYPLPLILKWVHVQFGPTYELWVFRITDKFGHFQIVT